jgi:ubiquinone/menaquinone biosynthesis C-methylase UbiE
MNYDEKAATWDSEKRMLRAKFIADELSKKIETNKTLSALEFGCGTGLISFNLSEKFKEITLVDTSKGMIDVVNSKIKSNQIKNMVAYRLDITNQDILTSKYDIIYTSMVLHHILDIEKILKSLYNLLNNNGSLFIIDLDEDDGSFHKEEKDFVGHNGFNQSKLIDIMKNIGFNDINSYNFYNDIRIVENKDITYTLFLMNGSK